MDYSKLNTSEVTSALRYHRLITGSTIPTNAVYLLQRIRVEPGAEVAPEIVDLYIATQLANNNVQMPDNMDIDAITQEYYRLLAPAIYLPSDYSQDNLVRAKRILRIIQSLMNDKRGAIKPISPPRATQAIRPMSPRVTQAIKPVSPPRVTQAIKPISPPRVTQSIKPISSPRVTQVIKPISPPRATQAIKPISPPRATQAIRPMSPPRVIHGGAITIMPVVFSGPNRVGDFGWMINQPQYNDVLFLFNDNERQFLEFMRTKDNEARSPAACDIGGGNAVIRPYQCIYPQRAAGIPTGDNFGGYQDGNYAHAKATVDTAINYIRRLIETGIYKRIAYSAAEDGYSLGTSIFSPSESVKQYIVKQIWSLQANNRKRYPGRLD